MYKHFYDIIITILIVSAVLANFIYVTHNSNTEPKETIK